jgi:biotin carboxyl carrier protein
MTQRTTYRVRVAGQDLDVTIEATEQGLVGQVGEQRWVVRWRARGPHAYTLTRGDAQEEVLVAATAEGYWVALAGYQAQVSVVDARALRLAAALPRPAARRGRYELRAPMPGRVLTVRVAPGELVARGAVVATLEAMKMENELRAPEPGRVVAVHVREGEAVEHGALLLVLEPAEEPPGGASE